MMRPRVLLAEMTREQIRAIAPQTTVILPTTSTEQHGPHLPIMTDNLACMTICQRAAEVANEQTPVTVAPPIHYGSSHHHFPKPGVLSLSSPTFIQVVKEILESLVRSGFPRIAIINGHGGNDDAVRVAATEVSLAHNGILFLDEAPEFGMTTLQGLREPVEEGWVSISRAGATVRYPASLQLVLAFNPCPCGNLGRPGHACVCSLTEIQRYWRRVGGALLDRIDIRVPVAPVPAAEMCRPADPREGPSARERVIAAVDRQRLRFAGLPFSRNSRVPAGLIDRFCPLDDECRAEMTRATEKGYVSSRAFHAILRIARTIADLDGAADISKVHLLEAVRHRRFGDGDFYWSRPGR